MINSQDLESLRLMRRDENLPEHIEDAVTAATLFFHSGGGTGPLGPRYLGVLLAAMGERHPRQIEPPPERVDFRKLPKDGSVNVEAFVNSEYQPGVFLGMVDTSVIVQLDGSEEHRELSPLEVRLAPVSPAKDSKKQTKSGRAAAKSVATA